MDYTCVQLYEESKEVLKVEFKAEKDKYVKALKEIGWAKTSLASVTALVTAELDAKAKVSKAALKDMVSGDARVLKEKEKLDKWTLQKEICRAEMDYLEHDINLNKKMMDSLLADKKYLGG